jgi:DNA (cytosine-5)-methyltransferase 1
MKYRFADLFSGIGGFHIAFHQAGARCVFASEIDPAARKIYETNFSKISPDLFKSGCFKDDILKIPPWDIPDHDILCAGFPCQPFSQAGYQKGFDETFQKRGRMFFILADIIRNKRPRAVFLENVRNLLKHDKGRTFETVLRTLDEDLKYRITYKIVRASDYGLPQHRPRIYLVGFRKEDGYSSTFEFPAPTGPVITMSDIFNGKCNRKIGYTLRAGGRGSPHGDRRNYEYYTVDGTVVRLGPSEGRKLMGFPDDFILPKAEHTAMKLLGNSVAVTAVKAVAQQILKYLSRS